MRPVGRPPPSAGSSPSRAVSSPASADPSAVRSRSAVHRRGGRVRHIPQRRPGAEAPGHHRVEVPRRSGSRAGLLGPVTITARPVDAQLLDRLVEELGSPLVRVQQERERSSRRPRRRGPVRGRRRHCPGRGRVAAANSGRRRHARVPRGTRHRPGRGSLGPGRCREPMWTVSRRGRSRPCDADPHPRTSSTGRRCSAAVSWTVLRSADPIGSKE